MPNNIWNLAGCWFEEAAALWESLAQSHPFIDGNQRTAFAATYTFLASNGAPLTADAHETYDFIAALYAANQFSFEKANAIENSNARRPLCRASASS